MIITVHLNNISPLQKNTSEEKMIFFTTICNTSKSNFIFQLFFFSSYPIKVQLLFEYLKVYFHKCIQLTKIFSYAQDRGSKKHWVHFLFCIHFLYCLFICPFVYIYSKRIQHIYLYVFVASDQRINSHIHLIY